MSFKPRFVFIVTLITSIVGAQETGRSPSSEFHFEVSPETAMVDVPVNIKISGLLEGEEVTLYAKLSGYGPADWESSATFVADAAGSVDPGELLPVAGSYDTVDGMGLFWSMSRTEGIRNNDRNESQFIGAVLPGDPLYVDFRAEVQGRPPATQRIERLFITSDVTRLEVRDDGLWGTLFVPPGEASHPALLVPHGGFCGFPPEQLAAGLAANGFAAFAIQYCGADGQAEDLSSEIPLEYFETAIEWLQRRHDIMPDRIGIVGLSTGGVIALLVASTFPEIRAVASIKSGGLNHLHATYRGKPLPRLPDLPLTETVRNAILEAQPDFCKPGGAEEDWSCFDQSYIFLNRMLLHGMGQPDHLVEGVIPVERINGPILLVSGIGDLALPSTLLFEIVVKRLEKYDFPFPFEHVAYPGAGHRLGIPHLPRTDDKFGYLLLGGNAKDAAAANIMFWPHLIEFLQRHLSEESLEMTSGEPERAPR